VDITNLRCEYRPNPLGIDVLAPRLSWVLASDRRGARQTAYRIQAASSQAELDEGAADVWDSGKVASDESIHVAYAGPSLSSGQRVYWRVRVWDEDDQPSGYSAPAWWEMGLLDRSDWQGRWIGAPLVGGPRTTIPCPFLRKGFVLDQPVVAARLYVTALGLYECHLNGQRVGDDVFTPGWTDYRQRAQYQVYDVTDLVTEGDNTIGAILGDGWYCGHLEWSGRQRYGDRPKLLAHLKVTLVDGSTATISTDETWKATFGPIVESDMLMGESYDARLELPGWDRPGYDDSGWLPVVVFEDTGVALAATNGPTVQRIQELSPVDEPVEIVGWPISKWIYDFGQNMVGWVRLRVSGPEGLTITLRYGEMLDADGVLYTGNLRTARATDHYTLRGEGEKVYEPRFTFHGFRYVEVSGAPGRLRRDMLTGVVLHSDTPPTGTFECSDPLVNQLQHNIVWGQKGNFVDVPTDCPQRDERLGWTGDARVFVRTATFNMDVAAFFTKWQQDLADAQYPSGAIPPVAPNTFAFQREGEGFPGGPAWEDAFVICPWTIYLCYGDRRLLETYYDGMARFVDYLVRRQSDVSLWGEVSDWMRGGFGDWLALDGGKGNLGRTPKDLIGAAFLAYSTHLMSRIAAALGKTDDAGKYEQLYQDVRQAFIERYVTPQGLVASQTQTAYVLALHFGLLPEHLHSVAVEELVRDIKDRDMHLSTGFVGSAYLPHALTKAGQVDVAYALLLQKTWPSWLYSVTQGATTIWERWDGWTHDKGFQDPGMNSFNHYAYGAIGEWLYRVVAGVDADPERPGFKHILLRPRPGGGLTYAKAAYDSMYGRIVSHWWVKDDRFAWQVTIPPNTTATVYVPASENAQITEGGMAADEAEGMTYLRREAEAAVFEVASGTYDFSVIEEA
jgi:alpha-L-rhamnosidase